MLGAKRRYDFLVTLLVAYASGDDDTVKEILGRQLEIAILSAGHGPSGDSPAPSARTMRLPPTILIVKNTSDGICDSPVNGVGQDCLYANGC